MTTPCLVDGCDDPGLQLTVLYPSDPYRRVETMMCMAHHIAVDAGDRWYQFAAPDPLQLGGERFVMGEGLPPLASGMSLRYVGMSSVEDGLLLTVTLVDHRGVESQVQMELTPEVRASLSRLLQ